MRATRPLGLRAAVATMVAALSLSAFPTQRASAQRGRGRATISGVIFDSLLTNRPLEFAEVELVGLGLTAFTDGAGRFRIDSVPAGHLPIPFFHHLLDSLSLGAGLIPVPVPRTGTVTVRLRTAL